MTWFRPAPEPPAGAAATVVNCTFAFRCPRRWIDLEATADPLVRSCAQCAKPVHWCRNESEFTAHAHAGHCVAIDLAVAGEPAPVPLMGAPRRPD